jgi:hypothetical protein
MHSSEAAKNVKKKLIIRVGGRRERREERIKIKILFAGDILIFFSGVALAMICKIYLKKKNLIL